MGYRNTVVIDFPVKLDVAVFDSPRLGHQGLLEKFASVVNNKENDSKKKDDERKNTGYCVHPWL